MSKINKIQVDGVTYDIEDKSVPEWAKQNQKPSYKTSELENDSGFMTETDLEEKELNIKEYVDEQISNIETGGGITELPIASATTLGGVKIGDNLSIDENGVLSASGSGSSLVTYSTEERRIGTCLDGRPLYERTLTGNSPLNANSDYVAATLTGVDVVTDVRGFFQVSAYVNNKNYYYTFYVNTWYNSTTYLSVFYKGETEQLIMLSGSQYLNKPFTITIQYTKVSDLEV